ncbi:MAG: hypothetical protein M3R29_03555 [Verrucomicrobiota bacterium]|nr:hypothetical protein [Verrucomicrobiota bacterium]
MKATARFARIVSWIGHPLVFITVSVALVVISRLANRAGLIVLLTLFVSVILPTALLLFGGVRSGRWSDADVSVPKERARFYPVAIPISAIGVLALWLWHAPGFVLRGALVTFVLFILAAIVNFYIKLSLHALFAFYCTTILFRVSGLFGTIAFALAVLVFWSRLYLQRHDLAEMLTGTSIGLAGGIATAWWP